MKDLLLGSLFVCLFMGYRLTDCYPSSQGESMRVARSGRAGRSTLFPSIVKGTDRSDFDNQQFLVGVVFHQFIRDLPAKIA